MEQPLEHIAIIPDGNRRWARKQGKKAEASYRPAIERLSWIIDQLWPQHCPTISFWWGSVSNITQRPQKQIDEIYHSLYWWLQNHAATISQHYQAEIRLIGRWKEFFPQLQDVLPIAPLHPSRRLNLLFAYDGRDEIRAAAEKLCGGGVSEAEFEESLWMSGSPSVDLVLRCGSIGHLSAGFLLWWIAHAQLAFTETLWPDLQEHELRSIIAFYQQQERRMGR